MTRVRAIMELRAAAALPQKAGASILGRTGRAEVNRNFKREAPMSGNYQTELWEAEQSSGLAIVPPEQMGDEALALFVADAFVKIRTVIPYIIELRQRFAKLPRGKANISGCSTWTEFCERVLHRTDRAIRKAIAEHSSQTEGVSVKPTSDAAVEVPAHSLRAALEQLDDAHFVIGMSECHLCGSVPEGAKCECGRDTDCILVIEPSDREGFYFVKALFIGRAEGTKRAMSKAVLSNGEMALECFVSDAMLPPALARRMRYDVVELGDHPKLSYNDFLYSSHDEYVREAILGLPPEATAKCPGIYAKKQ